MTTVEPLKREDWLTCPLRSSLADHWRPTDESGHRTCLCLPEGFDPRTAPECGAVQPSGLGVCQVILPGEHTHQCLLSDGRTVVTWASNIEGAAADGDV